ncbi:copper chaperone PCu(A)C [Lysobacter sp. A3-1-A15]
MTRVLTLVGALLAAMPLVSTAAPAAPAAPVKAARGSCALQAAGAWVRLPPVAMPMLAGFVRLHNPCASTITVLGARSDAFGDVSLHESTRVDGISRMRPVARLPVPPGAQVELQPGGLHLMLRHPRGKLEPDGSVDVVLELEGGGTRAVLFEVRAAGSR